MAANNADNFAAWSGSLALPTSAILTGATSIKMNVSPGATEPGIAQLIVHERMAAISLVPAGNAPVMTVVHPSLFIETSRKSPPGFASSSICAIRPEAAAAMGSLGAELSSTVAVSAPVATRTGLALVNNSAAEIIDNIIILACCPNHMADAIRKYLVWLCYPKTSDCRPATNAAA